MHVLSSFGPEQGPRVLRQQGVLSSFASFLKISLQLICRAFCEILRLDRLKYGAGEDYEIREVVADEWQQCIDDVVAGAADLVVGTAGVRTAEVS